MIQFVHVNVRMIGKLRTALTQWFGIILHVLANVRIGTRLKPLVVLNLSFGATKHALANAFLKSALVIKLGIQKLADVSVKKSKGAVRIKFGMTRIANVNALKLVKIALNLRFGTKRHAVVSVHWRKSADHHCGSGMKEPVNANVKVREENAARKCFGTRR